MRDVTTITDEFYGKFCDGDDPNPGQVAEAGQGQPKTKAKAKAKTEVAAVAAPVADDEAPAQSTPAASGTDTAKASGADIAKRNIEAERKEGAPLKALGAGMLGSITKTAAAEPTAPAEDAPPVTLLNAKPEAEPQATAEAPPETKAPASKPDTKTKAKPDAKSLAKAEAKTEPKTEAKVEPKADTKAEVQTASIGSAATQLKVPPAKGSGKCKVWTASYGGQRAVIIKAKGTGTVNYTVLDVTESNEKREVDAYIAAYAKGGEKVGTFPTQTKALNKAFELCPEG